MSNEKKKMNKKKNSGQVIAIVLLLALVVGGGIFGIVQATKVKGAKDTPDETVSTSDVSTPTDEKGAEKVPSANATDFSREGSVEYMSELFREFAKDEASRSFEERMTALYNGEDVRTVVSADALNMLHLQDFFADDEHGEQLAVQSILSISEIVLEFQPEGNYSAADVALEDFVYFDEEAKLAYIPLDIFISQTSGFSFELIWIDGQWKFLPYSFIQGVQLSEMIMSEFYDVGGTTDSEPMLSDEEVQEALNEALLPTE